MKVIPIAGALVLMMLLVGSASAVAATSTEADYAAEYEFIVDDYDEIPDDDYVDDYDTTDNDTDNEENVVHLRGRGTLFAMGSGQVKIRGTGRVLVFAEEVEVIVSSNAWVRALGDWNVEYIGNGKVKYTGSGVLQICGRRMMVDVSGNDISLKASGRGCATLKGDWDYWVIHWPRPWWCRPRPCCCVRPAITTDIAGCQNSALPVEYAPVLE